MLKSMGISFAERPNKPGRWPLPVLILLACALTAGIPGSAQTTLGTSSSDSSVKGSLSGVVTDADGAEVPGARVKLSSPSEPSPQETFTDPDGRFTIPNVSAGGFRLTITSSGFATSYATGTVMPGQYLQVPTIIIPVATANSDVEVTLSNVDLAEAEIHVEEHQRLVGFVPNFFVTYDWHAAPLTSRQKFQLARKTILDPASFVIAGAIAGIQQGTNSLPGYGPGIEGYAKRFGAVNADFFIGNLLGGAVLPSLFHQDPRYFYKGTGSAWSRAVYAFSTAIISRGDNGKRQPAYASVLGDFAAGAASNLYYPASNRNGASVTLYNGLISIGSDGLGNVVQEFLFKRFTPHAPKYPQP
jgi:hypothetical protein